MLQLYNANDYIRSEVEAESDLPSEPYRSEFWRDYARILHSPSFRRLTGKTQLFPNNETDFFRNRLTHSLEVAQIAKSITKRLNNLYDVSIDEDLVSFAALSHDLGHPPFGHQGEEALDECMQYTGGFEGNAQTLRILSKIEKKIYDPSCSSGIDEEGKDIRVGLNLTYRTLASILKYDQLIPDNEKDRKAYHKLKGDEKPKPIKGYYKSEAPLVKKIKRNLIGDILYGSFKTIECSIMDIADDISYSIYDLEDAFKAGFLSPMDLLYPEENLLERIVIEVNKRTNLGLDADQVCDTLISIYGHILEMPSVIQGIPLNKKTIKDLIYFSTGHAYHNSKNIASNGALRTQLTSRLVGKFIRGVTLNLNKDFPLFSKVTFENDILQEVEILKTFTYESQILSPKLKIAELRGKEIVKKIFETIVAEKNYHLLPEDYQAIFLRVPPSGQARIVCDFIAGMTNKYAIEFYGRLTSESPETIFKPL